MQKGLPFEDGKRYTLKQYKEMAESFSSNWETRPGFSKECVDKTYWEVVQSQKEPVVVAYGSDISFTSGFPTNVPVDSEPSGGDDIDKEMANSCWNLNNVPHSKDSLLEYVQESVAGVTTPWVYAGMLFSTFCFHVEDNCL